ncbi:MAG: hypothetical protein ABW185_04770, partial [Sedimenticola sp.]
DEEGFLLFNGQVEWAVEGLFVFFVVRSTYAFSIYWLSFHGQKLKGWRGKVHVHWFLEASVPRMFKGKVHFRPILKGREKFFLIGIRSTYISICRNYWGYHG